MTHIGRTLLEVSDHSEAVNAMAKAAETARQIFCIDEPPLPTLLCEMTWSAEEIARTSGLPESVMDGFYRTVFNEHATGIKPMTKQELRDTQTALLDYIRQVQTNAPERLRDGIAGWDELLEAMQEAA